MQKLDTYVQQEFGNPAQALVNSGVDEIRKCCTHDTKYSFEAGLDKIKKAVQVSKGEVDLTPLVELGYEEMQNLDSDGASLKSGLRILDEARALGARVHEATIAQIGYNSAVNRGAKVLRAAEADYGIRFDRRILTEKAYQVLAEGNVDYLTRALDVLLYAEEKGAKIDASRLGDSEKLEEALQRTLEICKDKAKALRLLKALGMWGRKVASDETISQLERILRLEQGN